MRVRLNSRVKMELVDAVREFREFGVIFSKNCAPNVRHIKPNIAIFPRVYCVLIVLHSFLRIFSVIFMSLVNTTFILTYIITNFRVVYFCRILIRILNFALPNLLWSVTRTWFLMNFSRFVYIRAY